MNEAQLKALLRKTQAAAARAKPKKKRTYDATLDATRPPADEATEAADAVYGVTMQEPGVSSLVSVRMKGAPVDDTAAEPAETAATA